MTMDTFESHNGPADTPSMDRQSSQQHPNDTKEPQTKIKLHEMGEALEMAETRCNTLKEQLDHMRHLYRERTTNEPTEVRPAKPDIVRQNSRTINTDTSGAAVLTINNILSGITNSINRLSELHSCMEDPQQQQPNGKVCRKPVECTKSTTVRRRSSSGLSSDTKRDLKRRLKRSRTTEESGASTLRLKRPGTKGSRMTLHQDGVSTSSMKHQRRKHRRPARCQPQQRNATTSSSSRLVEIYHNAALDYAESDEVIHAGRQRGEPLRYTTLRRDIHIPQLSVCEQQPGHDEADDEMEPMRSLSPIKEHTGGGEQMVAEREVQPPRLCPSTHYQAPTISSRMKRVARGYFHHFASCKAIPFCAAKSTSPSHNIGINIQQVMSIMKGRHVLDTISPTLAHNIGLAADRLHTGCVSAAVVSSYSSRVGHAAVQPCPLLPHLNMELLRTQATEVPPEEVTDGDEFAMDVPEKVRSDSPICWAMDTNRTHNGCTCVQPSGLDFNEVLQKYQQHTANTTPKQMVATILQNTMPGSYNQKVQRYANRKYRHIRSVYAQYNDKNRRGKGKYSETDFTTNDFNNLDASQYQFSGKERILKSVLMNLHSEFSELSEKYDALTCNAESKMNTDEISGLEKRLNEKEVEIQMVMSLYNEVNKLTEQLRMMKEHTGGATQQRNHYDHQHYHQQHQHQQMMSGQAQLLQQQEKFETAMQPYQMQAAFPTYRYPQTYRSQPRRDHRSSAAMHLTKLLRQIQAYQDVFRNGVK